MKHDILAPQAVLSHLSQVTMEQVTMGQVTMEQMVLRNGVDR